MPSWCRSQPGTATHLARAPMWSRSWLFTGLALTLSALIIPTAAVASTTARGSGWSIQHVPPPAGAANPGLSGVSCPSATACISVGAYNPSAGGASTLAERWNGIRWSVQSTPNPKTWSFLNAVSCSSASACTAVGYYYPVGPGGASLMLAERWNGTRWSIQSTPNPAGQSGQLLGVSCPSVNACTAVGYSGGTLAEHWNGTHWSIQTTPDPAPKGKSQLLTGVSCPSATACTAVGAYWNTSVGHEVTLAEHWNGTTWSIQSTPNPTGATFSEAGNISCPSVTACTAVGIYNEPSGGLILAERWNGTGWSIQSTPIPAGATSSSLGGVSCTSANACTATGGYTNSAGTGLTLAESWNGTTWSVQSTPNPAGATSSGLGAVSCSSATACTAIGSSNVTPMLAERHA
jgi:hypothetical protein